MPDARPAYLAGPPLTGEFWRVLAPRWAFDPLSGEGAARNGGRFNPRSVPALYMSFDINTAVAEYQQDLRNRPGTFCVYRVAASRIADLREAAVQKALKVTAADLVSPWKRRVLIDKRMPPTWTLAQTLIEQGANGLIAPSVQYPNGTNLVLWRWNQDTDCEVTAIDPQKELPRDQASWPLPEEVK